MKSNRVEGAGTLQRVILKMVTKLRHDASCLT
jgi:hypothetical protein